MMLAILSFLSLPKHMQTNMITFGIHLFSGMILATSGLQWSLWPSSINYSSTPPQTLKSGLRSVNLVLTTQLEVCGNVPAYFRFLLMGMRRTLNGLHKSGSTLVGPQVPLA